MLKLGLRLDQQVPGRNGVPDALVERQGNGLLLCFDPRSQIGQRIIPRLRALSLLSGEDIGLERMFPFNISLKDLSFRQVILFFFFYM